MNTFINLIVLIISQRICIKISNCTLQIYAMFICQLYLHKAILKRTNRFPGNKTGDISSTNDVISQFNRQEQ